MGSMNDTMTKKRTTYLYRLIVTKPEESKEPYWQPEAWDEICKEKGWNVEHFEWPVRTTYLHRGSALERAAFLRRLGATVEVERSQPVVWGDEGPTEAREYRILWQREGQSRNRALRQSLKAAESHAERQRTAREEMTWIEPPLAELTFGPVIESRAVGKWEPV